MSARASIHAMFPLDEAAEVVLDRHLDAHAAEVRRTDAAHLLGERRHHIQRALFCDGIKHAAQLLEKRADEAAVYAERRNGGITDTTTGGPHV